jgi:hypothetical protein
MRVTKSGSRCRRGAEQEAGGRRQEAGGERRRAGGRRGEEKR